MRTVSPFAAALALVLASCDSPPAIPDARAAIAAAHSAWQHNFPDAVDETEEEWQQTFTAALSDGVWLVRQKMPTPTDRSGAYIYIEAETGRIVDAKTVD